MRGNVFGARALALLLPHEHGRTIFPRMCSPRALGHGDSVAPETGN